MLPLPADRRIPPAPTAEVLPALRVLASTANDEAAWRDATAAILKLGVPALEPLQTFAGTLPVGDAGRGRLDALGKTLACIVTDTAMDGQPPTDDAERRRVQGWLDGFQGKPLTSAGLVACALDAAGKLPTGADEMTLRATRGDDLGGVRVVVTLHAPGTHKRHQADGYVGTAQEVFVDGACVLNVSGAHMPRYAIDAKTYADFAGKADAALATEADQPFVISIATGKWPP